MANLAELACKLPSTKIPPLRARTVGVPERRRGKGGGHSTNGKIPIVTRFCESWHMKHVAGSHPLGSAMVVTGSFKLCTSLRSRLLPEKLKGCRGCMCAQLPACASTHTLTLTAVLAPHRSHMMHRRRRPTKSSAHRPTTHRTSHAVMKTAPTGPNSGRHHTATNTATRPPLRSFPALRAPALWGPALWAPALRALALIIGPPHGAKSLEDDASRANESTGNFCYGHPGLSRRDSHKRGIAFTALVIGSCHNVPMDTGTPPTPEYRQYDTTTTPNRGQGLPPRAVRRDDDIHVISNLNKWPKLSAAIRTTPQMLQITPCHYLMDRVL